MEQEEVEAHQRQAEEMARRMQQQAEEEEHNASEVSLAGAAAPEEFTTIGRRIVVAQQKWRSLTTQTKAFSKPILLLSLMAMARFHDWTEKPFSFFEKFPDISIFLDQF